MKKQSQSSGQKRGFRWWSRYAALAGGALILVLGASIWLTGGAASSDLAKQNPAPGQSADVIQGLPIAESEVETISEVPSEPAAEVEVGTKTEPQVEAKSDAEAKTISFATDVMPIFEARCVGCHGTDGSWDGSSYELVMTTGDHAPVVIPGDVEGSLLAQKLIGTHEEGSRMPPWPLRKLSDDLVQVILDWIAAGAPE